jgi:hypothetical protein
MARRVVLVAGAVWPLAGAKWLRTPCEKAVSPSPETVTQQLAHHLVTCQKKILVLSRTCKGRVQACLAQHLVRSSDSLPRIQISQTSPSRHDDGDT